MLKTAAILASIAVSGQQYTAQVVKVVDGDTVIVQVLAWANTPFETMSVRLSGIDAPETRKPPGKCKAEIALGLKAKALAATLVRPGDAVTLTVRGTDKYFRVDGAITLPDGRDWATVMLGSGLARVYAGRGSKPNWCAARAR